MIFALEFLPSFVPVNRLLFLKLKLQAYPLHDFKGLVQRQLQVLEIGPNDRFPFGDGVLSNIFKFDRDTTLIFAIKVLLPFKHELWRKLADFLDMATGTISDPDTTQKCTWKWTYI